VNSRPRKRLAASTAAAEPSRNPAGTGGEALLDAFSGLLEQVGRLAVARGVTFAAMEDVLKSAFVEAARRAQPEAAGQRIVSRISTATGLTRREVTRLLGVQSSRPPPRPSPATQVFTRWRADLGRKRPTSRPATWPRQGPAPSFEALARSVTQDVHPRSLLDELCRLGRVGVEDDTVTLLQDSIVPTGDSERAYAFLGGNVGDHLRAAVDNLLAESPPHLEQAVFADELSAESMAAFGEIARTQWKNLLAATVPALQALVDADASSGRRRDRRVRIGVYAWNDAMAEETTVTPAAVPMTTSTKRAHGKGKK
jgi:hypothetical protein